MGDYGGYPWNVTMVTHGSYRDCTREVTVITHRRLPRHEPCHTAIFANVSPKSGMISTTLAFKEVIYPITTPIFIADERLEQQHYSRCEVWLLLRARMLGKKRRPLISTVDVFIYELIIRIFSRV
jgi:hypothetical protein